MIPAFSTIRITVRCGRAGAMHDALRNHESLARAQLHGPAFKIDQQLAFDHVEKLIVVIVLVPVVLAFDHAMRTTLPFTWQSV